MNRLFRLLWILLRSRWASPCPPLGPCITPLRIWPNDLDLFLHVNNGVYLTLCDLGRVDLMLRSRALRGPSRPRRTFLVAAETIQFYRPLRLFHTFHLETRVVGWDEKAFFVQHRFLLPPAEVSAGDPGSGQQEETVAVALVEGRVYESGGAPLAPGELLTPIGIPDEPPPLLDWVQRWVEDQRALRRAYRGAKANPAGPSRR
jgi:acyl-CoA thioesterase FadM